MHTYTALYDTRQDAEAAQQELKRLGVVEADGSNLADKTAFAGQSGAQSGSAGQSDGLWSGFKGALPPDNDRRIFEEGVRQGGYLLTVNVDDQNADQVHDLLERTNAVDIDEREAQYRQTGVLPPSGMNAQETTSGRTEGLTGGAQAQGSASGQAQGFAPQQGAVGGEQHIPIVEEQVRVGKREISRGGVRVRSYVVETPVHEQVRLREEHVEVERRPVNQSVSAANLATGDLLQGRSVEVTETVEEAVVAKDARIVEEVVVRKDATERVETIDDTVRHTEVEVERLDPSKGSAR